MAPNTETKKYTRNPISNAQKAALREKHAKRPGVTFMDLAKWFQGQYDQAIHMSSVSRILSSRYNFIDNLESNCMTKKRLISEKWPDLEKAVSEWTFHPANTATITQEVIRSKATQYWQALYPTQPMPSFSNGWLMGFQKRNGISRQGNRLVADPAKRQMNSTPRQQRLATDSRQEMVTAPPPSSTGAASETVTTPQVISTSAGNEMTPTPTPARQPVETTGTKVPEEEFDDQRRKDMLKRIEQKIGLTIPPTIWAFFWLADLDRLANILTIIENGSNGVFVRSYLMGMERETKILLKWMQKEREPTSSFPPSVNMNTRWQCLNRDHTRCIITQDQTIDVPYLYPLAQRWTTMDTGEPENNMWTPLRYFWTESRVNAWHAAAFPGGKYVDDPSNRLCLSPSANRYHLAGYFALKPIAISEDKRSLIVGFYWLLKGDRSMNVDLSRRPSLHSLDKGPGRTRLFDHESLKVIKSGDEIKITTDDPITRPLPSWDLLELQWYMNRVLAMSGAADLAWEDEKNDDADPVGENSSLFG